MELNRAQKQAVAWKEGPCLVLAGPGSGKTLTIVKRIEYLIKAYKVRPEEILVITFTRYAAKEMQERFYQLMGGSGVPVTFGTFHGIFYGILKWACGYRKENVLSGKEKYALLSGILSEICLDEIEFQQDEVVKEMEGEIGSFKNRNVPLESYEPKCCSRERFRQVLEAYEKQKRSLNRLDFEDMLLECRRLFRKRPDILKKWQERFPYILVDEFQDINEVQYDVLRMLAAPRNNVFAVGDDDQSIYGFRGASPEIMKGFLKDYPNAGRITLGVNYRSTAHIVNGALRVIGNNQSRYAKDIRAGKQAEENICIQEVKDPVEESQYVLREMHALHAAGESYTEMAVLYRTAAEGRAVAEALAARGIPFSMREQPQNLYEHFALRDLCSYLRLSQGEMNRGDFLRIANRPNRYIGRDSLAESTVTYESLRNFYCDKGWMQDRIDQLEWDMKMIRDQAPYAAIQYLRKRVGYEEFLKDYAQYVQGDLQAWIEVLDEAQELCRAYGTIPDWLEHVRAIREQQGRREQGTQEEPGVALLTMHGAKGLEYDNVFVIRSNEGVIPYKKAKLEAEIEEERRLFYVAMTRARKRLFLSYVRQKNGKDVSPSRFIHELFPVR